MTPMSRLLTACVMSLAIGGEFAAHAATLPQLPQAQVNVSMPTVNGSTLNATCATLQAQLNAAAALNVNLTHRIILATGTTCTGRYTMPSHTGGTGWILLTGPNMASLPPPGTRVTVGDAALMPKIKHSNNANEGNLVALTGAQRYRVIGIEFLQNDAVANDNWICLGYINECQNAANTGYFILDRIIIRDTTANHSAGRAIKADTQLGNVALIDSHCAGIKKSGAETQCFQGDRIGGPVLIQNNYLEAAGENVMFCGGADSNAEAYLPHDITYRLNESTVNPAWRFAAGSWVVKTLFELKCGVRVLVEGNTFYNMPWDGGGWVFRLTPRNQGGPTTYSDVSDLTIRHNLVRDSANWIQVIPSDQQGGAKQTKHAKRWQITNNLAYGLGSLCGGGAPCGNFIRIEQGSNSCTDPTTSCNMEDLTVTHNTVDNVSGDMLCTIPNGSGLEKNVDLDWKDNLVNITGARFGVTDCNTGGFYGLDSLNRSWSTTWVWLNNSIVRNTTSGENLGNYPQGTNSYPTNVSTLQFTNVGARDYTLQASSPANNAASDGRDQGVNFSAYNAARAGGNGGGGSADVVPPAAPQGVFIRLN